MTFPKEEGICPFCKRKSFITRKWVLNNYKTRYNYTIYHHDGFVHYSNTTPNNARVFKKGIIEKVLIETINSENFKDGLFLTRDIKKRLQKEYQEISSDTLRENLHRLVEIGMLEKVRKGRQIYFLNAIFKDRLNYVFDSVKFSLGDTNEDTLFRSHVSIYNIRNDKTWPLYFLPYRIFGDTDITYDKMRFKAIDLTNNEDLKVLLIEDNPREKRILIRLNKPLFPNENMKVRFDYDWQEPRQNFVFTAATHMNAFEIVLSSNYPLKIQASRTISTMNELKDLSKEVVGTRTKKWRFVYSVKLKSIRPFSVLQFRWKRT